VLAGGSTFAPGSPVAWTLPAGEGAHTVYVQWQDSAGNWSDVRSATIGVDTSAPSFAPSHLGLIAKTQLNAGQATVSATSVATDAGSGVATSAIAIARSSALNLLALIGVPGPTGTTTTFVDTKSSWTMRSGAVDVAGNSRTVDGATFSMAIIEDSSTSIRYTGTWRTAANSSASGGTTRYASTYGASATLSFTGRSIAYVAPVGGLRGRARIYVDGVSFGGFDLGGSTSQARRLVFTKSWETIGAHTIRVMAVGTKGRPRVDLDGFVALR
jgi:hypothetical protein